MTDTCAAAITLSHLTAAMDSWPDDGQLDPEWDKLVELAKSLDNYLESCSQTPAPFAEN